MTDFSKHANETRKKLREMATKSSRFEATLDRYIREEVQAIGGMVMLMDPTGKAGVPDVLILYKGIAVFVELKTTAGVVADHQKVFHETLKHHGFPVQVLRGKKQIDEFIDGLKLL